MIVRIKTSNWHFPVLRRTIRTLTPITLCFSTLLSVMATGLSVISALSRLDPLDRRAHDPIALGQIAASDAHSVSIERMLPALRLPDAGSPSGNRRDFVNRRSGNNASPQGSQRKDRCLSVPAADLAQWIDQAARNNDVSHTLIVAVMFQESRFDPCAISPKGALGIMQLMPATINQFALLNPFDAQQNINVGAKLLKQLSVRYRGDLRKTLAAYNAGTSLVDRDNFGVPNNVETTKFVRSIEPVATLLESSIVSPHSRYVQ